MLGRRIGRGLQEILCILASLSTNDTTIMSKHKHDSKDHANYLSALALLAASVLANRRGIFCGRSFALVRCLASKRGSLALSVLSLCTVQTN
jgi:hypothetical protein